MATTFEAVLFEKSGAVAVVTLNRPEQINAYNMQMRDDLWEVFSAIQMDRDIRAVVINGAGERGFCAGADLREFGTAPSAAMARWVRWERDVFGLLAELRPPTVAAIHGHVIGSGLEIAMLCDLRVASQDVQIVMPETGLGLIPAAAGTQMLPRLVRQGRALEILLGGRRLNVDEAKAAGLVQRVVERDALGSYSMVLANQLAALEPKIASGVRRAIRSAMDEPMQAGLALESHIALSIAGASV